jgi:hypothetical protein
VQKVLPSAPEATPLDADDPRVTAAEHEALKAESAAEIALMDARAKAAGADEDAERRKARTIALLDYLDTCSHTRAPEIVWRERREMCASAPRQARSRGTTRAPRRHRLTRATATRGSPDSSRADDEPAPPGLLRVAAGTWRWARIAATLLTAYLAVTS